MMIATSSACCDFARRTLVLIPTKTEEILYHVRRAGLSNESLVETADLVTLRRHIAACCSDGSRMQPPYVINGQQKLGEFEWIIELIHSSAAAIADLWRDPNHQGAEARADWILHNLYFPFAAIFEVQHRSCQVDHGREGYATAINMLLSVDSLAITVEEAPSGRG